MRPSGILNTENDDKYCSLWSILASLHPRNDNGPNRVSNFRQDFDELNLQGFDFSNGFEYTHVHILKKLNNISINIVELSFCQDQNKWKHEVIPFENSKNESKKVRFIDI